MHRTAPLSLHHIVQCRHLGNSSPSTTQLVGCNTDDLGQSSTGRTSPRILQCGLSGACSFDDGSTMRRCPTMVRHTTVSGLDEAFSPGGLAEVELSLQDNAGGRILLSGPIEVLFRGFFADTHGIADLL